MGSNSASPSLRRLLAGMVLVPAVLALATPARTAESMDAIRVTAKKQTVAKDYGPVLLPNPVGNTLANPSLADCQSAGYTLVLPVLLALPDDFGYRLTLDVSWVGASDLDLYLFLSNGDIQASVGTANNPERMSLANMPNGTYYLCVFNFLGAPTTFNVKASTTEVAFGGIPTPSLSTPRPAPTATSAPSTPAATAGATDIPVTAEPVETPGADGERSSRALRGVAAARQAAEQDDGPGTAAVVFVILLALAGAAGIAIVVLRIRRDTASS